MRVERPMEETEQRLLPAPARGLVLALVLTGAAVALVLVAFGGAVGGSGQAVAGAGAEEVTRAEFALRLFIAVGAISGLASLGGVLARRLGQPTVVGQMVAGLLLGPSALGALAPGAMNLITPDWIKPDLSLIAQAALAIFMFTVGMEFDPGVLGRQRSVIGAASVAMMAVPFALGVVAAVPFAATMAGPEAGMTAYVLFVGTALSVTAFPVLARIVQESGLSGTRLGSLAMVCAGVADVLAWCALAVVLAITTAGSPAGVLTAVALTAGLVLFVLLVVRPALRALAARHAGASLPTPAGLALVLGLIFALAAATDAIGVHAIFGAFLAGVVLPRDSALLGTVPERLGTLNRAMLLPVFFASIGLQTNVRLAVDHPAVLIGGAVLLAVAVLGKLGTASVVALAGGMPRRLALGLGVLMNARGVTEIVVLSTGLSVGVISDGAFAMLVVMALVTTVMTVPALRLLKLYNPAGPASGPEQHDAATSGVTISGKERLS
ncbi:cation:proton antiporter [Nonomuraea sp. NPDC050786]|uniref:cation:proton antiporter n=1 Tax=Nonomuraea sp. NPDC050786 TaxID=3154840 RepID=UPI00340FA925